MECLLFVLHSKYIFVLKSKRTFKDSFFHVTGNKYQIKC